MGRPTGAGGWGLANGPEQPGPFSRAAEADAGFGAGSPAAAKRDLWGRQGNRGLSRGVSCWGLYAKVPSPAAETQRIVGVTGGWMPWGRSPSLSGPWANPPLALFLARLLEAHRAAVPHLGLPAPRGDARAAVHEPAAHQGAAPPSPLAPRPTLPCPPGQEAPRVSGSLARSAKRRGPTQSFVLRGLGVPEGGSAHLPAGGGTESVVPSWSGRAFVSPQRGPGSQWGGGRPASRTVAPH